MTAFSETSREVSLTRNSEFKLFKMKPDKIENFNPNTFAIFLNKVKRNLVGLQGYINQKTNNSFSKVYKFNTCIESPKSIIDDMVDLVVTSPPYGDSKTTVAYGQFSRLSNQWMDFKSPEKVDNILMGGTKYKYFNGLSAKSADFQLNKIKDIDEERYNEVMSFTVDYHNSIKNISEVVNKGAYVCYVLGNRTVKGVQIPLDKITQEFFTEFGFKHINTFIRNIPNKRMPSKNSPSNISGVKGNTMTNEYIVIMRKY
jgi:DNA modification methylase